MNYRAVTNKEYRASLKSLFKGKTFGEACRSYVLQCRRNPVISDQPVEADEVIDGIPMHNVKAPMKCFPNNDPAAKHCCSREELLSEAARLTGLPEWKAGTLLDQMFSFQPELTYNLYGAVCRKNVFPGGNAGELAIPYPVLARELPEEWYISLQIPASIIDRMVWSCRKYGHYRPLPCSHAFAGKLLHLYLRRREEFLQKFSFEMLKFFWLEYGSMQMPRREIETVVGEIFSEAERNA